MSNTKSKIKNIAEKRLNQPLEFIHYGSHWTFAGDNVVVKVANTDLGYASDITKYLASIDFPALAPYEEFKVDRYYFYLYQKGQDGFFRRDVQDWLGKVVAQLHRITPPDSLHIMSFKEMNEYKLDIYREGFRSLDSNVQQKIMRVLERAYLLPADTFNHGDLNQDNVVEIDGEFMLIDWDLAMMAPNEYDLAVIKYAEIFGVEPAENEQIEEDFGQYDKKNLDILIDAIMAISLVWFSKNISKGYFGDNGELQKRIARLMGDKSVEFSLDYPVYG